MQLVAADMDIGSLVGRLCGLLAVCRTWLALGVWLCMLVVGNVWRSPYLGLCRWSSPEVVEGVEEGRAILGTATGWYGDSLQHGYRVTGDSIQ